MAVPTYQQLITLSSNVNGLVPEALQERLLTILAMLASGTGPDGTSLPAASGAVTLLASSVLGSPAAAFDFTSIPATANHLELVVLARSAAAVTEDFMVLQFNADTGANYDLEILSGLNATASAGSNAALTAVFCGYIPGASATASKAGESKIIIPGYRQTNFHKVYTATGGWTDSVQANDRAHTANGSWRNTAAINEVKITLNSAGNFATGSAAYLYGLT